jgi:hypothetical protein
MVLDPGKDFALIVPSSVDIAPHQVGMSPPIRSARFIDQVRVSLRPCNAILP